MRLALAVELKVFACLLLVVMPSIAISQTGPLASAHSPQEPVIALDAIFKVEKNKRKL